MALCSIFLSMICIFKFIFPLQLYIFKHLFLEEFHQLFYLLLWILHFSLLPLNSGGNVYLLMSGFYMSNFCILVVGLFFTLDAHESALCAKKCLLQVVIVKTLFKLIHVPNIFLYYLNLFLQSYKDFRMHVVKKLYKIHKF